jgi:hypothetical protein
MQVFLLLKTFLATLTPGLRMSEHLLRSTGVFYLRSGPASRLRLAGDCSTISVLATDEHVRYTNQ